MLVGYARIATTEQSLDLQKDALQAAGCERLFTDTASGARAERPGLTGALKECRPGDTLIVWKLDRLGRSLAHLVETVRDLVARGVGFKSLQESIDTTTSDGKLIFHRYSMESPDKKRGEYLLSIPYTTDEELDRIIYNEIWREAESIADLRNCFTEGDVISLDDPYRRW